MIRVGLRYSGLVKSSFSVILPRWDFCRTLIFIWSENLRNESKNQFPFYVWFVCVTCSISSDVSYSVPLNHINDSLAAFSLPLDRRNTGDSGIMKSSAAIITMK